MFTAGLILVAVGFFFFALSLVILWRINAQRNTLSVTFGPEEPRTQGVFIMPRSEIVRFASNTRRSFVINDPPSFDFPPVIAVFASRGVPSPLFSVELHADGVSGVITTVAGAPDGTAVFSIRGRSGGEPHRYTASLSLAAGGGEDDFDLPDTLNVIFGPEDPR
jgi:hypothetical protein